LLTIKRAALALGVTTSTIHRLLNDGIIAGEQITPGAPWRIRLTDELKARFNADPGDGFLPTVLQRVKRGELKAIHVTRGRQKGLRIKVMARQTELFEETSLTRGPYGRGCKKDRTSASKMKFTRLVVVPLLHRSATSARRRQGRHHA
jgi:hypothetical protein